MNSYLLVGSVLSAIAALLHMGCIVFGAPWYRFFGAGEHMANLAEQGSKFPGLITSGIVCVLTIWSVYALSGAGLIAPLPFRQPVLIIITAIYLLRGFVGLIFVLKPVGGNSAKFWLWSSLICILFGMVHLLGVMH